MKELLNKLLPKKSGGAFSANPNDNIRKKQMIFIGVFLVILVGLAYMVQPSKNNDASAEANEKFGRDAVRTSFEATTKKSASDEDIWLQVGAKKIEDLNKKFEEKFSGLEEELAKEREKTGELQKQSQDSLQTESEKLNSEINDLKKELEKLRLEKELAAEAKAIQFPSSEEGFADPSASGGKQPIVVRNRFFKEGQAPLAEEIDEEIVAAEPEAPRRPSSTSMRSVTYIEDEIEDVQNEEPVNAEIKTASNYIPAGTFFPAVLLGGVDAPTGGQAQDNPHPVFLMVEDLAFMPNKYRYDIKECRVVGHSYGELSSERAIMRLETLSCIDNDGRVYERRVKGHVFGEDGKAGLRGKVVEKTGQILMRGLLAGVASGIGTAFQTQATTYTNTGLGTTSFIDPGKTASAGIGAGVGKGLDQLSQYYMNLAEKLFPIIEIGSQRVVDILLTEGIDWLVEDDGTDITEELMGSVDREGLIQKTVESMAPMYR